MEVRSIDYVPAHERHGRVHQQGPFWFLGNFNFLTIAIGFVGPVLHLSWGWTALAVTLGVLLGTVFQAFHASQGAEMGLPQMIQSRAQFGYRGVVVPLAGALFTFIGFNTVDTLLTAEGLRHIWGIDPLLTTLGLALGAGALAIWGHDFLHLVFRWIFWIALPLYSLLSVAILFGYGPIQVGLIGDRGHFSMVAFATQFAAAASFNITFAPFVSDYTRYLPADSKRWAVIVHVFTGSALAAIWLMLLGAWLAAYTGADDGLVALLHLGNHIAPGMGLALCLVSIGALIASMGMNAYSGMLTFVTGWDSFSSSHPGNALRIASVVGIAVLWVGIALLCGEHAIDTLSAMLVIMLYLLCPWTAVNLVDYFFLRQGRYAILHLNRADGIYGAWCQRGLIAYGVGLIASIPFFVVPGIWTGPLARLLGGVDIAWVVGLAAAALAYLALSRGFDIASESEAIAESRAYLLLPVPPP
jgi:purine-cytosine permease-like protein